MERENEQKILGQFIPTHYHFNMLRDMERMQGFKAALQQVVRPDSKVLELGGGTGVLSFFAAQHTDSVRYVEFNPELVQAAQRILPLNPNGDKVEIIHADASKYLPPEPVDVVVCEMMHVGLLREKQAEIIHNFKQRYLEKFDAPLPVFVPEACIQAIQAVQQDYNYEGYHAPIFEFQDPTALQPKTEHLSEPLMFQMFTYDGDIPQTCHYDGNIPITADGRLNALRFITKNVLAISLESQSTIDWFNQYLVVPLHEPLEVKAGDEVAVHFDYPVGADFDALSDSLRVNLVSSN